MCVCLYIYIYIFFFFWTLQSANPFVAVISCLRKRGCRVALLSKPHTSWTANTISAARGPQKPAEAMKLPPRDC